MSCVVCVFRHPVDSFIHCHPPHDWLRSQVLQLAHSASFAARNYILRNLPPPSPSFHTTSGLQLRYARQRLQLQRLRVDAAGGQDVVHRSDHRHHLVPVLGNHQYEMQGK